MNPSFIILTDFFTVYPQALAYTTRLAAAQQARVVLLHACQDTLRGPGERGTPRSEWNKRQKQRELMQLTHGQPAPTELVVSEEFFPDAVQQTVLAHQGQLLVLGQPGADEQPVDVVAGIAQQLLALELCPVLVVPNAAEESAPAAAPPRRMLLAIDGAPFELHPLPDQVRQLLTGSQATVDAVFVPNGNSARPDAITVLSTIRLGEGVPAMPLSRLHLHQAPDVAAGILAEAKRLGADMLVVVARQHSLLGSFFHSSVTAQLLEQSPIPVLALPARD